MKDYTELTAISKLKRAKVEVSVFTHSIKNPKNVGNGTWGTIDFLVNHCSYTLKYN